MSKQRRIKKLVKGHLNKFEANGEATYNDGVTLTEVSPSAQQSALESLNLLNDADLATALGITSAGNPLLEAIDIDADGASHKDDFAPFDAREQVDTDGDGIGDNQEIVNFYNQIVALRDEILLIEAEAVIQAGIVTTKKGEYDLLAPGPTCAADYASILGDAENANSELISLSGQADDKLVEIDALVAQIDALPSPSASVNFNTPTPFEIWDMEADTARGAANISVGNTSSLLAPAQLDIDNMQVSPC